MKVKEYGTENKEVIVLLHGGGLSWWNYRAEAELLCERYHVLLPVLDGHAESDDDFISIRENAARIIAYIEMKYGGHVLCIGGLSLGAQIAAEILSLRQSICKYAVIESAAVIPSRITGAFIEPVFGASFGLIQKKWFAEMQFQSLRIQDALFEDYFRDTAKITKTNMITFLKESSSYTLPAGLENTKAAVRIVVGSKEANKMYHSAQLLNQTLPNSTLEVKEGLYHGEYALNHPKMYVKELLAMMKTEE